MPPLAVGNGPAFQGGHHGLVVYPATHGAKSFYGIIVNDVGRQVSCGAGQS